jgi:hypothetical protein
MTGPLGLTETRQRFLRAIVADVPAERVAEVHFFQPIKQGGIESGVAVVAAWSETPADASPAVPEEAIADAADDADAVNTADDVVEAQAAAPKPRAADERHVVYMALYRHTLKGPDRGKWETNVVAEADAPLVTVDAVVRGVQRRAGDVDDPTKMEGDEVRAFVRPIPDGIAPRTTF